MVLATKSKVEGWPTGQDASPIEAVTQPVAKLTSPIVPLNQTEEERWDMLVVTASLRRLNLETTGVILGDMVTVSAGGVAFSNPHMVAVLPRPVQDRRAINNQDTTVEELGRKNAE